MMNKQMMIVAGICGTVAGVVSFLVLAMVFTISPISVPVDIQPTWNGQPLPTDEEIAKAEAEDEAMFAAAKVEHQRQYDERMKEIEDYKKESDEAYARMDKQIEYLQELTK